MSHHLKVIILKVIIRSNKGSKEVKSHVTMVIHMYTKKSTSSSTKQWECSKRTALSCNGKTTTDIDVSRVGFLSEFGNFFDGDFVMWGFCHGSHSNYAGLSQWPNLL